MFDTTYMWYIMVLKGVLCALLINCMKRVNRKTTGLLTNFCPNLGAREKCRELRNSGMGSVFLSVFYFEVFYKMLITG